MTPQEQHVRNVGLCRDILVKATKKAPPRIAIILGTGLGALGDRVENPVVIPYKDLPGFPVLTVMGHEGKIVAGQLGGVNVLVLKGRKHFYETDDPWPLKTMIRALKAAGVETLFLTNAAGSLRAHIGVASLMLITDHINMLGVNPLTGVNEDAFGPRFFSMTNAWDKALQQKIRDAARAGNIALNEGVYFAFRGPNFETPAEIRMAQTLGGDAVGMSSVPECLIANHCGMRVAGVSCITNMGAGLSDEVLTHAHTLENAAKGTADFERLVTAAVKLM